MIKTNPKIEYLIKYTEPVITIQEESKEDFKKLMNWDEEKFMSLVMVRLKGKPQSPQTKPKASSDGNDGNVGLIQGETVIKKDKTADNPFDNLIKELENKVKNAGILDKQEKKENLSLAKQCKKIHEEEIKQKVQKLKEEFYNTWLKENGWVFSLNEIRETIDKIFGEQDD
jgi:hypothetical protein